VTSTVMGGATFVGSATFMGSAGGIRRRLRTGWLVGGQYRSVSRPAPADDAARPLPRFVTVTHDESTTHQHVRDPGGMLPRIRVGRPIRDRRRVERHEVCVRARRDETALLQ